MGDICTLPMPQMPLSLSKVEESAPIVPGDGLQSPSTPSSSPDPEIDQDLELPDHEPDHDHDVEGNSSQQQEQQPPQPQKRKGGRKPIYATSEERKQRNRQAQAAFRERRTEYIKQLENTIKTQEETLASLQASHRNAADECLMLRYKNSLLERILVEKGIDVQAELRAKTGSPNLVPTRVPPGPSTITTGQGIGRFPINKFGGNRRPLSISAKSDGGQVEGVVQTRSPLSQATSASHLPSPIAPMTRSPNFLPQGGAISPPFGPSAQPSQQLRPQQQIRPQFNHPVRTTFAPNPISSGQSNASAGSSISGSSGPRDSQQGFFISSFQNHYDQLDQEYDAQANMLDDQDADTAAFPTAAFPTPSMSSQVHANRMPPPSPVNPNAGQAQPADSGAGTAMTGIQAAFDPSDPMLDADPFGLSASMYFPTPYSFDAQR